MQRRVEGGASASPAERRADCGPDRGAFHLAETALVPPPGSTAPQEVAFTFANGLAYVERALAAGLDIETFGPRLSFFFAAHNDLLEEVAKFRAARRLWAQLMRERYQASDRAAILSMGLIALKAGCLHIARLKI